MSAQRLLLLCHHGGWDRLYQAASCAATAAATGWQVDVVFYFGALEKLMGGRLDEFTLEPRDPAREAVLRERADEVGTRGPQRLFEVARATGLTKLFACSASLALLDAQAGDPERATEVVDAVVGWPTTVSLLAAADRVLYL